ncbi:MAG: PQQ-binding-like beta-propeller repeat protein [Planctomycetota bacterium]
MALRGDLASVDLAQVFQMLALNKKVGLLSIQSATQRKMLYFDPRGVTIRHNAFEIVDKVAAAFVRAGRLDAEALEEVREHAVREGHALAESLLAGGYLQASEFDAQFRFELEEEIYDLFFCRDAKFAFHEGVTEIEGCDGAVDERFFFHCDSVIMEAARRIDEWAYITERVPSTSEVLVAREDAEVGEEFGPDAPAICGLLDGRRDVARVAALTGLTPFQICKPLSQLLDAGLVEAVADDQLVLLAAECREAGRLEDALSLYERAVAVGEGLPETYGLAADACRAADAYEACARHLSAEAEHRAAAGDPAGAAKCLHEARSLLPTDLQVRERLVELCLGERAALVRGFDPVVEGKELVELLTALGDHERVRALLELLLHAAPGDPDLKKALVNVHIRTGDQKRVVQLYEAIADDLVQQNKPLEAVGYLQKILLLDRGRADVAERVRSLYEFDERARRRGRSLHALAALFCLLCLLGVGYWFYNDRAEAELASIDVTAMVAAEDFAGAKARYAAFIASRPLTTSVAAAEAELQKIESAQQMFEARRESARAVEAARLRAVRDDYRAAWAAHRDLFAAGQPEQAMASVTRVRALLQEAGEPQDLEWAHEQKVQQVWQHFRDYLDRAAALGRDYDRHLATQDYAAARAAALALHEDFSTTEQGRRALVPVVVSTRPAGAVLLHEGAPLTRSVDGRPEPVTTPGVVLCSADSAMQLTAQLDGFEDQQVLVRGAAQAEVTAVMRIVPERVVSFGAPPQTGVGCGGGWLAVGLRGGRLGFARTDGRDAQVRALGGLKAVESTPVVAGGRVFFVSNEGTLEAVAVDPSVRCDGWPVTLDADVVAPLTLADGRILAVDSEDRLSCWEQSSARRLWRVDLGAAAAAPPTVTRRQVHVGVADGRVLTLDLSDGVVLGTLRAPAAVTTRVHVDGEQMVFGCADGEVRAVDRSRGDVSWRVSAGRAPGAEDVALLRDRVCIVTDAGVSVRDRSDGRELGAALAGEELLGLFARGDRVFARARRSAGAAAAPRDVLIAVDGRAADVQWEYVLAGEGTGAPAADAMHVMLAAPEAGVALFR